MILDENVRDYLDGKKFADSLSLRLLESRDQDLPYYRLDYLTHLARGRSVIHVGCVDHLPLLQERVRKGVWLHGLLASVARRCVGLDIDANGISVLRERLNIHDVFALDITRDDLSVIGNEPWDYLFLPEVLEHIDDPTAFLSAIRSRFSGSCAKIVITVPNALRISNHINARRGIEVVNTDHRFWFTPYSLCKITSRAGLRPLTLHYCRLGRAPERPTILAAVRSAIGRTGRLSRMVPALRDSLVLTAEIPG